MLVNSLKLFEFTVLLSLVPSAYLAIQRGLMDPLIVADALGYSILPFLVGLGVLFGFRHRSNGGLRYAAITSGTLVFLAFLGNLRAVH